MKTQPLSPRLGRLVLLGLLAHSQTALAQDATVSPDGSGTFKTVQEAVNAAPVSGQGKTLFWVSIKPGTYREKLVIPKGRAPVKLTGEDPAKTILTFNDSADTINAEGKKTGTFDRSSTLVLADDFTAENLTFENSFGRGSQALALHFGADRGVFRHCRFVGWQDTVLLKSGRAYFENCVIEGVTDFIFGGGAAWFEKCELHCLAPGYITAASTPEKQPFGFVFADCKITGTGGNWQTYLGRPWRPFGSVTFLRTEMPDIIRPAGWHNWDNASNEQTARYAEFDSRGPGARPNERAPWSKQLTPVQASSITIQHVLEGWNPNTVLSGERIAALPPGERTKWEEYLQRSRKHLSEDKAVLAAEVKAANLSAPLKAPDAPDFKLPASPALDWFGSEEAKRLATVVVSFQIPSGGWSKHLDFTKEPRATGMHWSSQSTGKDGWHYVGTFDNRSTTEQLLLLAAVFGETRREEFKAAFLKGLDYVFDAQFPNGGWPQVYPLEGGYHDHVTFNDDAMVHILQLLDEVARREPQFSFVDEERRKRAATALENGIRCILKAQVVQNGRKTVWCAQHEPLTLAIAPARYIEPPALSGGESVAIVRFLMKISNQSPTIVSAIEDAVAWFERSKITGIQAVKQDGKTRYQQDPESKEVRWARFYHATTNQPMFPGGQTGSVYDSFEQMAAENRVAYDFYVQSPADLLTKDLPKWRAKNRKP